jgi:hypothetical protein
MDLEIYYYDNRTSFSRLVREILEYVIKIAEERYDLTIYYEVKIDDTSIHPYMIVNNLPPIVFDDEPDIDALLKILVMSSNIPLIYNGLRGGQGLINMGII